MWKDIIGFEGCYQISHDHKVKSLRRFVNAPHGRIREVEERILVPVDDGKGKDKVKLFKEGKSRTVRINTLMRENFGCH